MTPSVTAAADGTPRATTTGRPHASASIAVRPKPSRSETRQVTSQARIQRGTSCGGTPAAKRTQPAMPSARGAGLELVDLGPAADERERAAAPRRARLRRTPRAVAGGSWRPRGCRRRARAARRTAQPSAATATSASPSLNASRSTPALTTCRRPAERPRDGLEARGEIVRDGEHRAGVADGLARRLADARRALGVRDVGAVRGQRVRDAGGARGAAGDRPGRHQVVAPDDVGTAPARGRAGAPAEARVLAQRAQAPAADLARGRRATTSWPSRSRAATRRAT